MPAQPGKEERVPMTGPPSAAPASPAPPGDLAARLFRALYREYDLHAAGGTYVAVPKGAACYTAPTLAEIARRISREHPGPAPATPARPGSPMSAPDPFLLPPTATAPGRAAAALACALTARGLTGIITAAAQKTAVISVTADLTVWTDGSQLWCTAGGQRRTWPVADTEAAAIHVAALARPGPGS